MGGKHLEHERTCQAKLVPNWKPSKRWVRPQPEYGGLLSIFLGCAIPTLGAHVWMYGQSWELSSTKDLNAVLHSAL
eukprot:1137151-Pelagomonas_calceolata.AAC.2